jgi:hypothetical protein
MSWRSWGERLTARVQEHANGQSEIVVPTWLREVLDESPAWGPRVFLVGPIFAVVLTLLGVIPWGVGAAFAAGFAGVLLGICWNRSTKRNR